MVNVQTPYWALFEVNHDYLTVFSLHREKDTSLLNTLLVNLIVAIIINFVTILNSIGMYLWKIVIAVGEI